MATSSKVRFRLDTLSVEATKSLDDRIARAEQRVAAQHDPEALAHEMNAWFDAESKRVTELARHIGAGSATPSMLSQFEVSACPTVNRYEAREARANLDRLLSKRSKMLAKTAALVPDEEGCVTLTRTQLADFFDL